MEIQMWPKRKETLWPCTIGGKAKIYEVNQVAFNVGQFLKFQLVGWISVKTKYRDRRA